MLESFSCSGQLFFEIVYALIEVLLLLLKLFSMLLLALSRVKAIEMLAGTSYARVRIIAIRCLSIPQQALLLLQLLLLMLIVRRKDQGVNIAQVPLCWNLKSCVLFPYPVRPHLH